MPDKLKDLILSVTQVVANVSKPDAAQRYKNHLANVKNYKKPKRWVSEVKYI